MHEDFIADLDHYGKEPLGASPPKVWKPIKIELSIGELWRCVQVGGRRHIRAIEGRRNGERSTNTVPGAPCDWTVDIDGAIVELSYARESQQLWNATADDWKGPDVGDRYQCRATRYSERGHLIVRPGDGEQYFYVLGLTHFLPYVTLVGGIEGKLAKSTEFWREKDAKGPGAFWVPQAKLVAIPGL